MDPYQNSRKEETHKLITQAVNGDIYAFERLYRQYYRYSCWLTARLESDPGEVEDLVSQVWLKVYESLKNYDIEQSANFSSWLYRIIKNNFIDSRRKAKALIYLEDIVDFAHLKLYTIDEVFDHKLSNTLLMKVIKSMPTEYSRPLQLRGLGYTYEEIAEELSIPIGTVKSSINRGRHMLKERLFLRFKVIY